MSTTIDNGRSRSTLPTQLVSPTAMGVVVSAAVNCRQPVDIPQWTTLNELYEVLADESFGVKHGKDFSLGYFGIGIGGSRSVGADANGIETRRVYQHKATDFNAFRPVPFLARLISEDVDPTVRDEYRMRVVRKVGDKIYVLYFLKKIGFLDFKPSMKIGERDPQTGNEVERPYIPKKEDLNPDPTELTVTGSVPLTNTYVNGTGKMDLTLNASDLTEIRNACRILYGSANVAAINELYLCHGIETTNDGAIGEGGTVNYKELQSAVCSFNITEAWARDANANTKMPWFFWYGNSLPLLIGQDQVSGL